MQSTMQSIDYQFCGSNCDCFNAPAGWSATDEGNARLPLVYNINGKLMLHDSIRDSPKGLIVPENNYTGLGNFGFMHLPGARLILLLASLSTSPSATSLPLLGLAAPCLLATTLFCCPPRHGLTDSALPAGQDRTLLSFAPSGCSAFQSYSRRQTGRFCAGSLSLRNASGAAPHVIHL